MAIVDSFVKRNSPIVRFLVVGVGNTILGLSVIFALKWLAQWNDVPANAIGYATGIIFSFVANRLWTFQHQGAVARSFARFVLICVIGYLGNLAVLVYLVQGLEWNGYFAQIVAIGAYTALTYVGSRYYVFRRAPKRLVATPR